MIVKYTSKSWTAEPVMLKKLVHRLGFRFIGEITPDDFIVKRRGNTDSTFNVLHISMGDRDAIQKYKLFKVDVFGV